MDNWEDALVNIKEIKFKSNLKSSSAFCSNWQNLEQFPSAQLYSVLLLKIIQSGYDFESIEGLNTCGELLVGTSKLL